MARKPTITEILIAVMAAVFLVGWTPGTAIKVVEWLGCDGTLAKPWTFLTYPFAAIAAGQGILFLVFQLVWFYWIGSSIEKSDGTKNYLVMFFGYTLLSSIVTAFLGGILGFSNTLVGVWLPLSALTCVWCARNQTASIRLMGVIPVSGRILAVITAVSNLLMYGSGAPVLGFLAVLPCMAGWFHGSGMLFGKKQKMVVSGRGQRAQDPKEFDKFLGQVRSKEKERAERERLRRLLEGGSSGGTSDPDENGG